MLTTGFDQAVAGAPARLLRSDGAEVTLAVRRWQEAAADEDEWLLDRCTGPALDLGCGPGRLVVALAGRGLPVLGVDISPAAAAQCRRPGGDDPVPRPVRPAARRGALAARAARRRQHRHRRRSRPAAGPRAAAAATRRHATDRGRAAAGRPVAWHRPGAHGGGARQPVRWAVAGTTMLTGLGTALGLRRTGCYAGRRSFVELTAPS